MKVKIQFHSWTAKADIEVEALNIKAAVEFQVASRANLSGADLSGANLSGAKWTDSIILTQAPIQISIPGFWPIFILEAHMKIGCELHKFEEWATFDDRRIERMSGNALEFWRTYKPMLMALCETRNKGEPK